MVKMKTLVTVLLGFFVAGCASTRTRNMQADYPEAKAQIEQRLYEILAAAENKDFDSLESYHLYGPKFTRFSSSSPTRLDAAATRKAEHDGLASLTNLKIRPDALKIDVFGNVGIATLILESSFDSGGKTVRTSDLSSFVFVNDRGDWKIVHEHLSRVPSAEVKGPMDGTQPNLRETKPASDADDPRR